MIEDALRSGIDTAQPGTTPLRRCAQDELGADVRVERRDRLAILIPFAGADLSRLADPSTRRSIIEVAADHGFTHVAIELDDDSERASLPRD